MTCRYCAAPLAHTFLDLGFAPPSNAYLGAGDLEQAEKYYPLKVMVCDRCWLVQTGHHAQPDELFGPDYAYFSSTSTGCVAHAAGYAGKISQQLRLNHHSFVIEIGSNDGYLLRNFVESGIPCLGIEPTASTGTAAETLGIPVLRRFFDEALGKSLAAEGRKADLIVGNNVYAHVPDVKGFTKILSNSLNIYHQVNRQD